VTDEAAAERKRLMAEGDRLHEQARALDDEELDDQIDEIHQRYRDLLPEVTVARCPDSGELVRWPIETMGLGGWFWDYHAPMRRIPEDPPRAWLGMTGAMRLTEPVEHPPFTVVPGPDVPFVVPRILDSEGVHAVVAEVRVGAHTGWTITYFGPLPQVTLVNLWGSDTYLVNQDGRWTGWDRELQAVTQYDFDLTPWLRSGKLLWLDESATLREGPDCPFVALPGRRHLTVIADGEIRHVETLA
jgi:hypothetical protein